MERTGIGADLQYMAHIQKQHFRRLCGHNADHQNFSGNAGIGFRKNLSGAGMIQNALIAPRIIILNGNIAGEHDAKGCCRVSCPQNRAALGIAAALRPKAGEHGLHLLRRGTPKQRRL